MDETGLPYAYGADDPVLTADPSGLCAGAVGLGGFVGFTMAPNMSWEASGPSTVVNTDDFSGPSTAINIAGDGPSLSGTAITTIGPSGLLTVITTTGNHGTSPAINTGSGHIGPTTLNSDDYEGTGLSIEELTSAIEHHIHDSGDERPTADEIERTLRDPQSREDELVRGSAAIRAIHLVHGRVEVILNMEHIFHSTAFYR